jgi:hypothetical protein
MVGSMVGSKLVGSGVGAELGAEVSRRQILLPPIVPLVASGLML